LKNKALDKNEIVRLLKENKQQVTASRLAICEYVLVPKMHITAQDVKRYLEVSFPNVSLATVYNTLNMLVDVGLLRAIHIPDSQKVIFDSTLGKHYHIYDKNTDMVYDFDSDRVKIDLNGLEGMQIDDFDIVINGHLA